ncbi:MAG: ABC transporter permease [Tenericutes bacterium GWC2_39_45]|nr:MAG: ABC transporter permease [Tenericutes bacterium GWC2_39_45]OHE31523.1 MAG: ABC transporter permease [Tenericutes bacterium GWD2_38_27]
MNNFIALEKKQFKNDDKVAYLFTLPYILLFMTFIVIPIALAVILSFSTFDMVSFPRFSGFNNYIYLLTSDEEFMKYILPNTIKFAVIIGPGGYILSFFMAWALAQLPHKLRTVLAIVLYSPSLTAGITMTVVWKVFFAGDESGYLNYILLELGMIVEPIAFLQSPDYLFTIMIVVALWGSMGVGFLAMLAGILNVDQELYEAAYIDGLSNRFQEVIYITIPAMKPQMLFGAVMAIVGTFSAGALGVSLSGSNPTPNYAGSLIVNHIEDYGFIRYDMGYAAALSLVLLLIIYFFSRLSWRFFGEKD